MGQAKDSLARKRSRARSERPSEGRPAAEERRVSREAAHSERSTLSQAAQQDRAMRTYFEKVASNKEASVAFLKEAGILDSKGTLAKPFRG